MTSHCYYLSHDLPEGTHCDTPTHLCDDGSPWDYGLTYRKLQRLADQANALPTPCTVCQAPSPTWYPWCTFNLRGIHIPTRPDM